MNSPKLVADTDQMAERYLHFGLGGKDFAIPLKQVREVLAPPELTPLPFMPRYHLGIMNLRGGIVSVLDLRLRLGCPAADSPETAIVIHDDGGKGRYGLKVDAIHAVLTIPSAAIEREITGSQAPYLVGVYAFEDRMVALLDVRRCLSEGEADAEASAA